MMITFVFRKLNFT